MKEIKKYYLINSRRYYNVNIEYKYENAPETRLINHKLSKIEELPLYPDSEFILFMKNAIDENNIIFKKSNKHIDDNNKKHRHEKKEYNLTEFSTLLKYLKN